MDSCIAVASDPPVDYWFATYRILSQQNSWDVTKVLTVWTWRMYMYEQNFRHTFLPVQLMQTLTKTKFAEFQTMEHPM